MANFGVTANKGAAVVQTVLGLNAAAASPRRSKLYDYSLGCGAAPADNAFTHIIQRVTTAPVGAAKVPNALDQADTPAATTVATDTVTADGAVVANAFLSRKALNQRATFRWVAAPGSELVIPATANNGLLMGLSAATATSFDYDALFQEQ